MYCTVFGIQDMIPCYLMNIYNSSIRVHVRKHYTPTFRGAMLQHSVPITLPYSYTIENLRWPAH